VRCNPPSPVTTAIVPVDTRRPDTGRDPEGHPGEGGSGLAKKLVCNCSHTVSAIPARNRPPGVRPKAIAAAFAAIIRRPGPPARKRAPRPLGTAPEPEISPGPNDDQPAAQRAVKMPRHVRPARGHGRIPPTPRVGSGVEHRFTKPVNAIQPAANLGDVNACGLGSLPQGCAGIAGFQGLFQAVIISRHC
jgi:hypothetical protein